VGVSSGQSRESHRKEVEESAATLSCQMASHHPVAYLIRPARVLGNSL